MEPESAIEASREAIKVCFMVGGPILAVCLIVGLLMGLAQAMSHIQDQALATVPKILAILAIVGFALPWFADRMMDFSKDQFSRPFMNEMSATSWSPPESTTPVQSLLVSTSGTGVESYYPSINAPKLEIPSSFRQASFPKPASTPQMKLPPKQPEATPNANPFKLPSYRFSRRPGENLEG